MSDEVVKNNIESQIRMIPKFFVESYINLKSGMVEREVEVDKNILLNRHKNNCDFISWINCARVDSIFTILSKNLMYKRIK